MTTKVDGTNGVIQNYDYQVFTTGFTYTFSEYQVLLINPAGTLATGSVTMPLAPSDGMTVKITTTQTITALTINNNTGQSIVGAATTLAANASVSYIYRQANATWYPF